MTTITNSTIYNNTAGSTGGGIECYGGTVTVSNSTIYKNTASADGGGFTNYTNGSSVIILNNDTVTGNSSPVGGGLWNNGTSITMTNSIVAGNTAGTGPDFSGTAAVANYDLFSTTAGMTIISQTGNVVNASVGLGTFGYYGGPTQTLPLTPTSPALNVAGSSSLSTDQRGFARGSSPDISYQLQTVTSSTASLPVNSASMTIYGSAFDTNAANDSITFDNSVTGTVTGATGTSLTVNLSGVSSLLVGTVLHVTNVTVDGVSNTATVQVGTIAPAVTASSANLPVNATTLTIAGFGFDTKTNQDSVTFDNGVTGTVSSATSTSLTVSLTGLSSLTGGTALHVSGVTVDGVSNSATVQVATAAPIVTLNTANIADGSANITINGGGFSSTPASNSVAFSSGVVGTVTSASATQLIVSVTTPPTSLGSLTATVTSNSISSGTAVQVGAIVWDSVVTRLAPDSTTASRHVATPSPTFNLEPRSPLSPA